VPGAVCFQAGIPAALLFVEAAHEQVDELVELVIRVLVTLLARRAVTDVHARSGHPYLPMVYLLLIAGVVPSTTNARAAKRMTRAPTDGAIFN
jgi:hypothetical protein